MIETYVKSELYGLKFDTVILYIFWKMNEIKRVYVSNHRNRDV